MLRTLKENIRLGRIALGIEKPPALPRPCNCGEEEAPSVHPDQMAIDDSSTPLHPEIVSAREDSVLP